MQDRPIYGPEGSKLLLFLRVPPGRGNGIMMHHARASVNRPRHAIHMATRTAMPFTWLQGLRRTMDK